MANKTMAVRNLRKEDASVEVGEITNGWQQCTIGDICTFNYGSGLPERDRLGGSIPVYGSNGIVGFHNKALVHEPGIILGRKGTLGKLFISQNPFYPIDTTFYITSGKNYDLRFFYYLLQTLNLEKRNTDSAVPGLNRELAYRILISLPPLPIQKRIAEILGAYDDKIELNRRINQTPEKMAMALYKHWFVDFGPFCHGKFVDSEAGRIPKGWEVKKFTDIINVLSGGTPKTSIPEYWNGDIPWFTPRDVEDSFYISSTERKITDLGLSKCNSNLYPAETVFITARGTVGKCALTAVPMAMSQTSYALIGKNGLPQYFVFLLLLNMVDLLKTQATGAVFDTIIVDTFRKQDVVLPPQHVLAEFCRKVHPWFYLIAENNSQNHILSRTRNYLLPKLLSGEILVNGFEEFTEKTV